MGKGHIHNHLIFNAVSFVDHKHYHSVFYALQRFITLNIDLRPGAIIETLKLRNPIYEKTAAYGHFGRETFPWEWLNGDLVRQLRSLL